MLNKEKYAKEIADIAIRNINIALKNDKPVSCREIHCSECKRHLNGVGCFESILLKWGNSEYKEPILDEVEKEYLKAVIKPFRNKVDSIRKIEEPKKRESICIYVNNDDDDVVYLPHFEKGKMYQNMEGGKSYTLEELGL